MSSMGNIRSMGTHQWREYPDFSAACPGIPEPTSSCHQQQWNSEGSLITKEDQSISYTALGSALDYIIC